MSSKNNQESKNIKELIISNFKVMINKVNASGESGAAFKAREYTDTIKAMESLMER